MPRATPGSVPWRTLQSPWYPRNICASTPLPVSFRGARMRRHHTSHRNWWHGLRVRPHNGSGLDLTGRQLGHGRNWRELSCGIWYMVIGKSTKM